MEFKVILSNGRQTFVDADNEKELQSAITKAKSTFGCEVSKVVPMNEEKFSVGGFLTGSVIGVALASLFGVEKKNLTRDRKFVNKKQGYEKSYASGTGRTGYKGNTKFKTGGITKQADGTYTHPSGFVIEPYDKGRYILLDPEGMDAVGEHMSLTEAKQTLNDMLEHEEYKTGGGVKNIPIAIKRKIDEINAMLPKVKEADDLAGGYFGSTHYSYVSLLKPIEIKGQYVYIYPEKGLHYMSFEKRYNVSKTGEEWGGKKHLMSDLAIILKAFKGVSKDNFETGGKTSSNEVYKEVYDYAIGGDRPSSLSSLKKQVDALAKRENLSVSQIYEDVKDAEASSSQFKTGGGVDERELSIQALLKGQKYPLTTKELKTLSDKSGYAMGDIEYVFQKMNNDIQYNPKYSGGGGVGKFEYKTINTRSLSGLKEAERLKANGWKIVSTGFDTIQFERLKTTKKMSTGGSAGSNTTDMEYNDILAVLKEKLDDAVNELPNHYEQSYNATGEEVESKSRDGFIPFTNGGYEVTWFESMSMFNGAGSSLPTKNLDQEMQRQIDYNYTLAKERFLEDYPEIVEELGEENIDYNSLYEAGYGEEAEQLSEWEMDYDGDDTILCEIGAYYYNPSNDRGLDGQHTIRLYGLVNLEAPYHRRGNLDDSHDIDITFNSIEELEEKISSGLEEITNWFSGDNYENSDREMKIRKMKTGGSAGGVKPVTYYVAYSSYFDSNKYDIEKMTKALKSIGATDIHTENDRGWSNQPEVVVFKFAGDGTDYEPTKAIQKAFDTDYVIVRVKDWRTKKFETGGGVDAFNPRSFTLGELNEYLSPDVSIYGFMKGWSGITHASENKMIFDYPNQGQWKQWKDKKLTMSDYGHLEVEKGSENLYLDLIVYELDGSDDPYTIRIFTKDDHSKLKEFSQMLIQKFKTGGGVQKANVGLLLATQMMANRQQRMADPNYRSRMEDRGLDGKVVLPEGRGYAPAMQPIQPPMNYAQPPMPMSQPPMPMYGKGGSVGEEITFRHWSGETKHGTIVEIFPDGSLDVSCGFGHCLVNKSDIISGAEKMARGSKIDEFNDIMENNVITEKQVNLIKTRLNSGALKSDAEIVQYIWDNTPDLTPDQNKKGIEFLMNLYKTPTGKERSNHVFGYRETEALENFGHFALAGFHDASRYGQAPYYIPMYDVYGKDGEYGFQYYYDGKVNIVGKKGMKTAGRTNDRNHVNKRQSHEVRYAQSHDGRTGYKGNTKFAGGGTIDNDAVRELQLFLENDGQLYSQRVEPIQKNLMTKLAQGNYDHMMAQKGFMILVELADKKYQKDLGSGSGSGYMLSMASRKELCRILEEEFYSNAKDGDYDHLIPKKYVGKTIQYKNGGSAGRKSGENAVLSHGFYVKINPYYTATIRDLTSFEQYLKRKDEIWGKEFGTITYRDKSASKEWVARMNELIETKKAEIEQYGTSGYKVGQHISVFRNQADRDAYVIAVSGDEILIEYAMPNDTTALNIIDTTLPDYTGGSSKNYEPISYSDAKKSKKWGSKIDASKLMNNPQSGSKFGNGGTAGSKVYYEQQGIGTAKYVINFYDGVKTHNDGSEFFDIRTFKNKVGKNQFIEKLKSDGYKERSSFGRGGSAGKDSLVPYVVYGKRNGNWENIHYLNVKPKKGDAEKHRNEFNNSLKKGGANDHLGEKYRVSDVKIVNQKTNEIVDEYKAPMFEAYGRGGSTDNPKEPRAFTTSNLYYNGKGKDVNGNAVVRISFPSGRAWSIQTNGTLPKTHAGGYDEKEINQYVKEFGSDAQKKRLKIYKS
jgi:hypothetical protein